MLHLENFFEKSFALLLTTPKKTIHNYYGLFFYCKLLYNGNYSEFAYIILQRG